MKAVVKKHGMLWVVLVFCLWGQVAIAQLSIENATAYSTNNGLPQSSVYGIIQSQSGFMWFATGDGICRFDGREWKTFKNDFTYKGKPASNLFNSLLYEDGEGTIWSSNASGIYFHKKQDTKLTFFCPRADTANYFTGISKIAGIENGTTVWGGNGFGQLFSYDIKTKKCKTYGFGNLVDFRSPSILSGHVYNHKVYIGIQNKIVIFDIATEKFTVITFNKTGFVYPANICEIGNTVYFNTLNKLYRINNNTAEELPVAFDTFSKYLYKANNTELYISSVDNFYYIYNTQNQTLTHHKIADNGSENVIALNCFYIDRNNNLWVGTEGVGVLKFDRKDNAFSLLNKEKNGISSNFIKGVLKYNADVLLIGTANRGLNVYNRKTGQNKVLLPNRNINYIYKDSHQRLWLGCDDGFYLEKAPLVFEKLPLESVARITPGANFVFSIAESPNGTVYFGTMYGLHYYNEEEKKVKYIFGGSYNLSIYFIDDNHVLISQYDGSLNISTINADKSKRSDKNLKIKARNPRSVFAEGKNTLWMATENGLVKYNHQTNTAIVYDEKNGLNNTYLYAALPDKQGNIWVSSNGGLSVFNKQTERFRNFDMSYGLQSTEFNTGSYYKADDGELFFGGINGLNYFYPEKLQLDTLKPLQALTGVKIYETPVNIDSLLSISNTLELNYNQNSIYLQFASLDFTAPEKNVFAYKLEGQDEKWNQLGTSNYIRFSALSPGTYHLYLKTANRDGTWGAPQKMITIVIRPPFWQTWWFISLLVLAAAATIAGAVYGITRSRYKKRMALLEKEKALQKIRLQLSQDIHDDIGGNLSMIALLSDKFKGDANAEKIAGLARNAQKGFRELIWSVNPVHDNLENFIYYLRNHVNSFLENTAIEVDFEMPAQVPGISLLPNVRRNLFLVYKEALNNVVKHAGATHIGIKIELPANKTMVITIADNGKGITNETQHGNGLQNFKHRMEAIGGKFELKQLPKTGVCLIFIAKID